MLNIEAFLPKLYKVFILILVLLTWQCNLRKPVAPVWDVQINIPLANRPYSIDSLIQKNPDLFQIDAQNGLVSYSYSQNIVSDSIGDKLSLKPQQPNPLVINAGEIPFRDFSLETFIPNPGINSGIVPAGNLPPISVSMPQSDKFDYIEFDSGLAILTIFNLSPIAINFQNPVRFVDRDNNEYIFVIGNVPPYSQKFAEISLSGKFLAIPLQLDTLYPQTSGSSDPVNMPDSLLKIELRFKNLIIKSARAKIPPTEILRIVNSKFIIDTSATPSKLKIARFKKGFVTLKIKNNFDVTAHITLTLPQFKNRATLQSFSIDRIISRRDSFLIPVNLVNYEFQSPYSIDTVYYSGSIYQLGSEDDTTYFRIFNASDELNVYLIIHPSPENEFVISYMEGIIKPITINYDTVLNVKLGKLPDKFSFDSLRLPDSKFDLKLLAPNIPFRLGGSILLADSSIYQIIIPLTLLNASVYTDVIMSGNEIVTPLTSYVARNKKLPEIYRLNSIFQVNPNYTLGSISSSDKLIGEALLEIPLNVGLTSGTFRDTLRMGDEKDDNGNIVSIDSGFVNKVQSGSLNFNLWNGIPIGVKLKIKLLDANRNLIQELPSSGSIIVQPGSTNNSGFVVSPVQSKISINMNKSEIDNFNNSEYTVVELELNTPATVPAVKIRNTDFIQVKVFASFNYKVEFDD